MRTRAPAGLVTRWAPCLAALLIAVSVGHAVVGGAFAHPLSDDWAYLRIAAAAHHGHVASVGWNDITLVTQVAVQWVTSAVTGASIPALRLPVLAAGLATPLLLWRLLGHSRGAELRGLAVLGLVLVPGWLLYLPTDMTDLSTVALELGAVVVAADALAATSQGRRLPAGRFTAALLLAAAAVGVRQTAAATAMAIAVAVFVLVPDRRRVVIVITGGAAVVAVGLLAVRSAYGDNTKVELVAGPLHAVESLAAGVCTLSFAALPLLVGSGWAWPGFQPGRRRRVLPAALVVTALILGAARASGSVLSGLSLSARGSLAEFHMAATPGSKALPRLAWLGITAVVATATLLLVIGTVDRVIDRLLDRRLLGRRPVALSLRPLVDACRHRAVVALVAFWLLSQVGLVLLLAVTSGPVFDRYLFAAYCAGSFCLLEVWGAAPHRWARAGGLRARPALTATVAAAVVVGALVLLAALDTQSLTETRWQAGRRAVAAGYDPTRIDAGFEWVGWHWPGTAARHDVVHEDTPPESWYDSDFPGFVPCVVVVSSPFHADGWVRAGTQTYTSWLTLRRRHLYIYEAPGCGPGPAPGGAG